MAHDADDDRGDKMKALVQEGYGSADSLHVRDIPRPELIEGHVLVRMRAASVNALDWHTTHGGLLLEIIGKIMRQKDEPVRGVDLAGTIEAVGPQVTRFKAGDDVFGGAPASFAEYVLAREDRLLLKPRGHLVYLTELIEAGRLRPVIDRTFPLSEGREALRYVGTGQARAKVVITA